MHRCPYCDREKDYCDYTPCLTQKIQNQADCLEYYNPTPVKNLDEIGITLNLVLDLAKKVAKLEKQMLSQSKISPVYDCIIGKTGEVGRNEKV